MRRNLEEPAMQLATNTASKALPFALMGHEPAAVKSALGDASQEWTWKPIGDFKEADLAVYASGGSYTTRSTGPGQSDTGEYT